MAAATQWMAVATFLLPVRSTWSDASSDALPCLGGDAMVLCGMQTRACAIASQTS